MKKGSYMQREVDMKKNVSLILVLIFAFALVACGEASPRETTQATSAVEQTTVPKGTESTDPNMETTATATTEPAEEPTTEPTEHTHHYTAEVTAATCTEAGYTTHSCTCGDSYTDTPVDALGHSYESKTVVATCTEQGHTAHICSCGDTYQDNYVNALGHQWGAWETIKEPTASATGEAERKCVVCGSKEVKTLPKEIDNHTHKYDASVTQEATCSKNGVKTFVCSCGDRYTESIGKLDHKYESSVMAPTCTNEGYTTYKCEKCGNAHIDNKVAALGHDYTEKIVNPTCTEKGYTRRTCSRCAYSYVVSESPAVGHSYTVKEDTATCTNGGTKTEECGVCGNKKTSPSQAIGHTNQRTETVEATCEKDGYTRVVCGTCGEVISNTPIPSIGAHSYETRRMSDVAQYWIDKGEYSLAMYANYTDWNVDSCKHCNLIDISTLRFAYSDYEAASIMLGYVNSLRESVYGTNEYNLVLDSTLLELAKIRAEELCISYGHGGTYTGAGENITGDGPNIYNQYNAWCNSPSHYNIMIKTTHKYFAYAIRQSHTGAICGVQLFWTPDEKAMYCG